MTALGGSGGSSSATRRAHLNSLAAYSTTTQRSARSWRSASTAASLWASDAASDLSSAATRSPSLCTTTSSVDILDASRWDLLDRRAPCIPAEAAINAVKTGTA